MDFPYGPFHRLESPTQTPDDAKRQAESGEIWGREPSWGGWPQVQAYTGPLSEGQRGIEFWTSVSPDLSGHPFAVRWSQRGRTTPQEVVIEDGFAKIACMVVKAAQA